MSNLDIVQTFGICLLMACALFYRHKYRKEARLRNMEYFEWDMNYQLINARYLNAIKELEATKAELELYKNHQSEA